MSRLIPYPHAVDANRALTEANATVATTRAEWERYNYRQVTNDEIQSWQQRVAAARSTLKALNRQYTSVAVPVRLAVLRCSAFAQTLLGLEDRHAWVVSFLFGVTAVVAITPLILLLRVPPLAGATTFLVAFFTVVAVWLLFLLPISSAGIWPTIERIRTERLAVRERITELQSEVQQWGATTQWLTACREAELAYEQSVARLRHLQELLASERNQLRTTDWRSLRGIPFEEFLARVFRMLGYETQITKTSGDQGVDLIVVGKGRRIAIQAKGYDGSVGNKSVQEAFAGQTFYRCGECAVVTNSRFTSGAIALAASVGCVLIDGSRIPELIEGHIY
jgi:hypothetical protein